MDISKILNTKHRTEWEKAVWSEIVNYLANAKSKKDFKEILGKLLSEDEKRIIVNRMAVLALVRSGGSYSEIGNLLWVSPVTISTIKKNFGGKFEHYKSCRSLPSKNKKRSNGIETKIKKSFWEELFDTDIDLWEILRNPPRPAGIGLKKHRLR